jgi:hypothetical protein
MLTIKSPIRMVKHPGFTAVAVDPPVVLQNACIESLGEAEPFDTLRAGGRAPAAREREPANLRTPAPGM